MLVSTPLLIEYEAVMTRDEHLEASGLSADQVGVILDAVAATAEPVRLAFPLASGGARPGRRHGAGDRRQRPSRGIVTFNKRDFAEVAGRFGIEVLSQGEALQRLETER